MAESIIDIINLARLANKDLAKPVPIQNVPSPFVDSTTLDGVDKTEYTAFGTPMVQPIKLKKASDTIDNYWLLPLEPLISIEGSNVLIKRKPAKRSKTNKPLRGTIKEWWTEDDLTINISGVFINTDLNLSFSTDDYKKLYDLCTCGEVLDIISPQLNDVFGIQQIIIESFDFPHTKGMENQNYTIKAYSDDAWNLLYKLKSSVSVSG